MVIGTFVAVFLGLRMELVTLIQLPRHENVVKLIGICPNFAECGAKVEGRGVALVLEYMDHADLAKHTRSYRMYPNVRPAYYTVCLLLL